jgi:hypothetical protein
VPARPEGVVGFAVVKENGSLAFPYGHLGAPLDLAGSVLGNSVNQFSARFIEPLNHFQEYDVVCSHVYDLL